MNHSVLGAIANVAFIVCTVATAIIVVLWIVEKHWLPHEADESWLYGESERTALAACGSLEDGC
jgi:hypothetical protein